MKALKGKVQWNDGFCNTGTIQLLVDKIPEKAEMVYAKRNNLYFAVKDGLVSFYAHNPGDQTGFGGRTFTLKVQQLNGGIAIEELKGPWSSRSGVMNREGFEPCVEVVMTDKLEVFERGYTFMSAAVTLDWLVNNLHVLGGVSLLKVNQRREEICFLPVKVGCAPYPEIIKLITKPRKED